MAGCVHLSSPSRDVLVAKQGGVPVLLYHHVAVLPPDATSAQKRWTLSPEKFDEHMRWIASHGFHPVTMVQLSAHLKYGQPLPVNPIVISFDDGWKDQYRDAFPVLKKYGFKASFFIITDSIGHSAYMNWNEVLELSNAGMDIESHSHTHSRLSVLSSQNAWQEIVDSKKMLEKRLHKPVVIFAYPYGSYGDDVVAMVKEAGYDAATTVSGLNGGYLLRADQSFTLSRYAVEGSDKLDYVPALKGPKGPVGSALFISLVQKPDIFLNEEGIQNLVDFAREAGIPTLFVQVYRENMSWFPSRIADDTPYRNNVKRLGTDPLALIISKAHASGIEVHAWMNLLSLSQNRHAPFLKKYGTDILTQNRKPKKTIGDFLIDAQYFLEPGDPRVRADLSNIVVDLLRAYPQLDGIQFDYIRYPDMEPHYGYTKINMERFKKATGITTIQEESQTWKDWKRFQVNQLLLSLVKTVRLLRPDIRVSVTGCMPLSRALYEAYQDWPLWVNRGWVDFVTLMDYSPDPGEFKRWLTAIEGKVDDLSKLKISVGAYKLLEAPEKFDQEFRIVEDLGMKGAIFHYGSLLENPRLKSIVLKINNRLKLPSDKPTMARDEGCLWILE